MSITATTISPMPVRDIGIPLCSITKIHTQESKQECGIGPAAVNTAPNMLFCDALDCRFRGICRRWPAS